MVANCLDLDHVDARVADSFHFAKELHRDFGKIDAVVEWCRSECRGDWRWQLVDNSGNSPGRYIFYFDDDRDISAFLIKWG